MPDTGVASGPGWERGGPSGPRSACLPIRICSVGPAKGPHNSCRSGGCVHACTSSHVDSWSTELVGIPVPPSHLAIFGQGDFRQPFKPAVPQLPIGGMAVSVSPWFHHVVDTSSRSVRILTQFPYNHKGRYCINESFLAGSRGPEKSHKCMQVTQ